MRIVATLLLAGAVAAAPATAGAAGVRSCARIAFVAGGAVRTVRPDGERVKRLSPRTDEGVWLRPRWAADGSALAFGDEFEFGATVWVADRSGDDVRQVTDSDDASYDGSLSPDGTRLAFVRSDDGSPEVVVADLATGEERVVALGFSPEWSPDGARIVYVSGRVASVATTDVRVVSADGSDDTVVTRDPHSDDMHPTWAPDGEEIVFERYPSRQEGWRYADVWTARADGSEERQLTTFQTEERGVVRPRYSPDGSHVAMTFQRGDRMHVWVTDPDGSDQHRVSGLRGTVTASPSWSPDGRRLAYTEARWTGTCDRAPRRW
jgi:Tol biopolymer transport system component